MDITIRFLIVIKCVAANYGTGLYNNVASYYAMVQDGNVGMNDTITADPYMITNKTIWHDHGVLAER